MRRVALLVGNSTFAPDAAIPNLRFPPADVEAIADVLKEVGSFSRIEPLIEADSGQIIRTLSTLLDEERGAMVFFYYSGHGKISDGGRLILAASNTVDRHLLATGVPFGSILAIKDDYSCSRFCAVLDCCYAGLGAPDIKGSEDEQLKAVANGRGIFFLGAANATTVAKENVELGHGVLTAAILEGLRTGEADVDNDGRITGPELFTWCKDYAKSRNYHAPVHVTRVETDDLVIAFSPRRLSQDAIERVEAMLTICWKRRLLDPSSLDELHKYFMTGKDVKIPRAGTLAADFLLYVEGTLRLDEFYQQRTSLLRSSFRPEALPELPPEALPELPPKVFPEPPPEVPSEGVRSTKAAGQRLLGIALLGSLAVTLVVFSFGYSSTTNTGTTISLTVPNAVTSDTDSWKAARACVTFYHVLKGKGQGLAIFVADDPSYDGMAQQLRQNADRFGVSLVSDIRYSTKTSDFKKYVDQLKSAKPNRILLCGPSDSFGAFQQQANAAGLINLN
jgi:Periplasmic binding protein/Caspase domain